MKNTREKTLQIIYLHLLLVHNYFDTRSKIKKSSANSREYRCCALHTITLGTLQKLFDLLPSRNLIIELKVFFQILEKMFSICEVPRLNHYVQVMNCECACAQEKLFSCESRITNIVFISNELKLNTG